MLLESTFTFACIAILCFLYLDTGTAETKPIAESGFIIFGGAALGIPLLFSANALLDLGSVSLLIRGPVVGFAGLICVATPILVMKAARRSRELNRREKRLPPELTP